MGPYGARATVSTLACVGLADISSRDAVLDAIDEYEDLGAEAFLQRYGEGLSRDLHIEYISQKFAALPVIRVAHRVVAGELLEPGDLHDLAAVKDRLEALGFRVLGDVGPVRRAGSVRSSAGQSTRTTRAASPRRSRPETREPAVREQRRSLVDWTVPPDDLRTRRELASAFGATSNGVIDTSPRSQSVLAFASPAASTTLDGWMSGRDAYRLTAEGRRGDQTWTAANQALLQHRERGWTVRLFEECEEAWRPGGKRYRYVGAFTLDADQPWTTDRAPDADDKDRSVICFRLLPVDS